MKLMKAINEKVHHAAQNSDKAAVIVYIIVRVLIILCMIRQILNKNYYDVFLCALSLILIMIPTIIESKTKIELPAALEIIICCFVFAAEILGEIYNFYFYLPMWDSILHFLTGCLAAAVGFGAVDLINTHVKRISMTPIFVVAVAFCFSMTIGVLWEFLEYSADNIIHTDMQKDRILSKIATVELDETRTNKSVILENIGKTIIYDTSGNELAEISGYLDIGLIDTMKDLFINMIGAVVFSIYGYLYLHKKEKYKFIENIIITEKAKV